MRKPFAITVVTVLDRIDPWLAETALTVHGMQRGLRREDHIEWIIACNGIGSTAVLDAAPLARVIPSPGEGATSRAAARDRALAVAGGEFILMVESGDRFTSGMPHLIRTLFKNPDVGWVAGRTHDIDEAGDTIFEGPQETHGGWLDRYEAGAVRANLRSGDASFPFHPNATVIRPAVLDLVGGWDPGLAGDFEHSTETDDMTMLLQVTDVAPGIWADYRAYENRVHALAPARQPGWVRVGDPEMASLVPAPARSWRPSPPLSVA